VVCWFVGVVGVVGVVNVVGMVGVVGCTVRWLVVTCVGDWCGNGNSSDMPDGCVLVVGGA